MAVMLPILSLVLAAFFKAVADTLSFHYDRSVFKWKDKRFWDPAISWKYVGFIKFTKFRADAWHLANSGMIICFCLAAVLHSPIHQWYIELPAAGILFNLTFNLFYNKVLIRKP